VVSYYSTLESRKLTYSGMDPKTCRTISLFCFYKYCYTTSPGLIISSFASGEKIITSNSNNTHENFMLIGVNIFWSWGWIFELQNNGQTIVYFLNINNFILRKSLLICVCAMWFSKSFLTWGLQFTKRFYMRNKYLFIIWENFILETHICNRFTFSLTSICIL